MSRLCEETALQSFFRNTGSSLAIDGGLKLLRQLVNSGF